MIAKKNTSQLQKRTRVARLERLLRDSQRFILEMSENYFAYEEKYMECFWCGAELDECDEECFAYQARQFAKKLAAALVNPELVTQESEQ